MKHVRYALALMLAGCLDEPAAPPGHAYEMRDQVLVADLDGDGFDDLVTWGHDGDPRVDSQVFVRWGGTLPLHADADMKLDIPAQNSLAYHETVSVAFTKLLAQPTLLVLECDDNGPDHAGQASRFCQLWKLTVQGREIADAVPSFTSDINVANFGNYARAPTPVYIADYAPSASDPRMIIGDHDRILEGPLGGDVADVTYTAPDPLEKPQAAFTAPPSDGTMLPEKLILVTSKHAGLFDGPPFDAGTVQPLFAGDDPMIASARDIAGLNVAMVPQGSADVTYGHLFNGFMFELDEVKLDARPQQLVLARIGGPSFVREDESGLHVDYNLDIHAGTFAAHPGAVAHENETVVAVGHFDGDASNDDSIMLFDATDRTHKPLCYKYNAGTNTINGC